MCAGAQTSFSLDCYKGIVPGSRSRRGISEQRELQTSGGTEQRFVEPRRSDNGVEGEIDKCELLFFMA